MIRIIDLDDEGLSLQQVLECIETPAGAVLRRKGHVIARLEPADDVDIEDLKWAERPEQARRGQEARERFARGEGTSHDELRKELGL